mmetsp:Transcript_10893/g.30847  ORF Transcript_10893/g.30847 Transcript_10893/m.30847 type:complete len:143 (+) Transcript_10893:36-464(+)
MQLFDKGVSAGFVCASLGERMQAAASSTCMSAERDQRDGWLHTCVQFVGREEWATVKCTCGQYAHARQGLSRHLSKVPAHLLVAYHEALLEAPLPLCGSSEVHWVAVVEVDQHSLPALLWLGQMLCRVGYEGVGDLGDVSPW